MAAIEEAAEQGRRAPVERTKALAFALAYLWAHAGGDRAPFIWFWRSLEGANDIARSQNLNAAMNAIRQAVGG